MKTCVYASTRNNKLKWTNARLIIESSFSWWHRWNMCEYISAEYNMMIQKHIHATENSCCYCCRVCHYSTKRLLEGIERICRNAGISKHKDQSLRGVLFDGCCGCRVPDYGRTTNERFASCGCDSRNTHMMSRRADGKITYLGCGNLTCHVAQRVHDHPSVVRRA